jgi:2-keto-4-pentenoate hydratase
MLDHAAIHQAAAMLLDCWRGQQTLPQLPPGCRPTSRAEGYAIQREMLRLSGNTRYGWKIAATSTAGQSHIGVDGPLAGMIHSAQVLAEGSDVPIANSLMKVAEVEFAFRMGATLAPRAQPYSNIEVMGAVATLHPAIEIPDSRYRDFVSAGAAQLIAENACADRFMLGKPCPDSWRSLNLAEHTVSIGIPGREPLTGIGRNVLGDPRIALTWLVNELSANGFALEAGQVITTGTCSIPIPVEPGVRIEADYGILGRITASFTD